MARCRTRQPRKLMNSRSSNSAATLAIVRAFTLVEVMISVVIAGICIGGIFQGYVLSARRVEWSGISYAAQALAIQRVEQARSCKWDTDAGVDELIAANFPMQTNLMDLPVTGTNFLIGTNFTTISDISTNPPLLRMIWVDCVWRFALTGRLFTNTVVTYRSPNN